MKHSELHICKHIPDFTYSYFSHEQNFYFFVIISMYLNEAEPSKNTAATHNLTIPQSLVMTLIPYKKKLE